MGVDFEMDVDQGFDAEEKRHSSPAPVTPPKRTRGERDQPSGEADEQEERGQASLEEEENGEGYDSTPLAKRPRRSPKTGPSPHCQSDRTRGCEDPRVLKTSLEYSYESDGRQITTNRCDDWHDRQLATLNEILKQNAAFFKRKNAALLGIQFVYEHKGQLHLSPEFNIDIVFVSGGKPVEEPLNMDVESAPTRNFKAQTIYDFMATGEGAGRVTKQMRDVVLGYYAEAAATKLSAPTVAARQKEASFSYFSPQPQKQAKSKHAHANSSFEIAYLHSEQAMLLMLLRQTEVLAPFLAMLPRGATLHQVSLLIASKNQMCRRCGACYFLVNGQDGILKTTLENYIQNFPQKGFNTSEDGINIGTYVSGDIVFDKTSFEHRFKQLMHADRPISDSRLFSPHVAQKCLPTQLTRKQRNELERQKESERKRRHPIAALQLPDNSDDDGD